MEAWSRFHVAVLCLTFFSYTSLHSVRRTLSLVKTRVIQEWTPSAGPKLPETTWTGASVFGDEESAEDFLGVLDATFLFSYALGLYVSGLVADRVNLRVFLTAGMAGTALILTVFGPGLEWMHARSAWSYLMLMAVNGMAQSSVWPCILAVMGNWFVEGRGKGGILGVWSASPSVGSVLGALMVSSVVQYGYEYASLLTSCVLLAWSVVIFFGLVPSPSELGLRPHHISLDIVTDEDQQGVQQSLQSQTCRKQDDDDDHGSVCCPCSKGRNTDSDFGVNSQQEEKRYCCCGVLLNDEESKPPPDPNHHHHHSNSVKRNALIQWIRNIITQGLLQRKPCSMTDTLPKNVAENACLACSERFGLGQGDKRESNHTHVSKSCTGTNSREHLLPCNVSKPCDGKYTANGQLGQTSAGEGSSKSERIQVTAGGNESTETSSAQLRDKNESETPADNNDGVNRSPSKSSKQKAVNFLTAVLLPGVIPYSLAYACVKMTSYTFFFWLPFYLSSSLGWSTVLADRLSILYDVGALVAATLAGMLTHRLNRRGVVFLPMVVMAVPTLYTYGHLPATTSLGVHGVMLVLVGAVTGGPSYIIPVLISLDLGRQEAVKGSSSEALATVTGIIEGTGTLGAALGQVAVPRLQAAFGWVSVFYVMMTALCLTVVLLGHTAVAEIRDMCKCRERSRD